MRKRILSLALALAMVLSLLPAGSLTAWAADTEPAEISTADDLKQLETAAAGSSFILAADITLPEDWSPVAAGYIDGLVLDGGGHTITLNGAPLFGNMGSSTVTNLVLSGQVTGDSGDIASLAAISRGTVRNCVSYADVTYTGAAGEGYAPRFAAGLIAQFSGAGTLDNCVYAGTLSHGNAEAYGSLANTAFFVSAVIKNCVGVGSARIGSAEGMSAPTEIEKGTNTLVISAADFDPSAYVAQLNSNRDAAAGDLEWEVKDGRLSLKRGAEAPEATAEEIAALQTAVGQPVDGGKIYTADSWAAYHEALSKAQNILAQEGAKQSTVVNATNTLNAAYSGLTERSLSAVNLAGQEVVSVTSASQLESLTAGKYYRLDADLEITGMWFGTFETMNAVLDGNGHTITLNTSNHSHLWSALGPDAVVQNLGVLGSVSYSTSSGSLANSSQGLIVNCWSRADVSPGGNVSAGGFVGTLKSGGAIVNSYVGGSVTSSGSPGVLAGNTEGNSLLSFCYGLTENFKGAGEGAVRDCQVKTRKDFYSSEFLALLNQNRGACGKEWTLSSEGYPHLGPAESYTPPEAKEITFTYLDGGTVTFKSDEGLTVSLQDVSGYAVGRFSMEGAARWQDTIAGNKDVLLVNENGTLNIYQPGSADVVAISSEADGSKELVRFTVTVVEGGAVDGFRLTLEGQAVGDSLTLQGSEQVTLLPEILRGTVWSSISPSQVQFSHTGALHRVNGTFYAEEPGEMTLSAGYMDKTVTVKIISAFVPVTKISPAPSGVYKIHQHNPNSENLGNFLDLTLSHGAGDVVVEPENASYRDRWTMHSSDPTVAEYIPSMIRAVLPYQAGTTTLTAVVEADGQQPRVTGSSSITIEYENPVASVSVSPDALTVRENESLSLPITFTGKSSGDVTEPAMDWAFSTTDGGQVEIVRDGALGLWEEDGQGNKPCIANPKYKINGVTAGTVTVTGTPRDQTGGAQAVTFTVTVETGTPLEPADNAALTAAGIANGRTYLTSAATEYRYGSEWEIFSLRRSGQTIAQEKLDGYLDSVESTYKSSPDAAAMKPTTIARVALTLGALGQNAANFRELNFIEMLYNSARIQEGGNELMWALIALDSREYAVPAGAQWTRDKLITQLITTYQSSEGGFGLNDNRTLSVDMTAMAIQALAPYYDSRQEVKAAVDKALSYLKGQMSSGCGFNDNAESTAQVVIALAALGLDPVDSANGFVRNAAVNLLTNLTGFAHTDGGYKHYSTDQGAQPMSTTQALLAFEAYRRFSAGENALYDLTDAADTRSVLAQRLAEASALQASDYTAETWAVLQKAVEEAQAVLEDEASEEAALKAADTALAAALAGLKSASSGGNTPVMPQNTITVKFRLIGDTLHNSASGHNGYVNWIRTMSVTVPEDATVYDAFAKALSQKGLRFEESLSGYIGGIQAPAALGGYWLREFDNGPTSGWKYMVNGSYPDVGLRYYRLQNGDSVIWRYVDDYTDPADNSTKWQEAADVDPSGTGTAGAVEEVIALIDGIGTVTADSGGAISAARKSYDLLSREQKKQVTNYALLTAAEAAYAKLTGKLPFVDVADGVWYRSAVQYVYEEQLFSGTSGTTFSPHEKMSRSMIAAVLHRLAGKPSVFGDSGFVDVGTDTWYTDAVIWAGKNDIVSGYGNGRFGPSDPVTREQLAAILYRYAKLMGYDTGAAKDLSGYTDASNISGWAREAMSWATANGLIVGRTSTTLTPRGTATRAEAAAILMRFAALEK